jgi:hypothetical protein
LDQGGSLRSPRRPASAGHAAWRPFRARRPATSTWRAARVQRGQTKDSHRPPSPSTRPVFGLHSARQGRLTASLRDRLRRPLDPLSCGPRTGSYEDDGSKWPLCGTHVYRRSRGTVVTADPVAVGIVKCDRLRHCLTHQTRALHQDPQRQEDDSLITSIYPAGFAAFAMEQAAFFTLGA